MLKLKEVRFVNEPAGSPPNSFECAAAPRGYLRRDVGQRTDTLDQAMLAGETVLRTAVRDRGPHGLCRTPSTPQKEVLRLMAAGLGNYRYRKLFRKDVVIKKREWQRRSNDCRAI